MLRGRDYFRGLLPRRARATRPSSGRLGCSVLLSAVGGQRASRCCRRWRRSRARRAALVPGVERASSGASAATTVASAPRARASPWRGAPLACSLVPAPSVRPQRRLRRDDESLRARERDVFASSGPACAAPAISAGGMPVAAPRGPACSLYVYVVPHTGTWPRVGKLLCAIHLYPPARGISQPPARRRRAAPPVPGLPHGEPVPVPYRYRNRCRWQRARAAARAARPRIIDTAGGAAGPDRPVAAPRYVSTRGSKDR